MAFVQADLDAINTAIASGAREVQYADKKVIYTSLNDLIRARVTIMSELNPTVRNTRTHGVYFKNRGFCEE
jgi:hypothetical protein